MSDDESTGIDHNNTLNDDVSYLFGLSIPCVYSACLFRAFIPLVYSACLFRALCRFGEGNISGEKSGDESEFMVCCLAVKP